MLIRKNRKFRPLVGILSISVTLLMITSCVTTEKSSLSITIEQSVQKKVDIVCIPGFMNSFDLDGHCRSLTGPINSLIVC